MCEPVTNTVCTEVESALICKQVEKVTTDFYFTIKIKITNYYVNIKILKTQLQSYNYKVTITKLQLHTNDNVKIRIIWEQLKLPWQNYNQNF